MLNFCFSLIFLLILTSFFFFFFLSPFFSLSTIPGKINDYDEAKRQKRLPYRQNLASFVRPLIQERVIPFVRSKYPKECGGNSGKGKGCQVCWSFVRRYKKNERLTHAMHFDVNALVTVVVSLSSEGSDFTGGLYVSTGGSGADNGNSKNSRYFLPLQDGDAVIHQSDLLHGVRVNSGERWSWIMWLKEDGCQSDPSSWIYTEKKSDEEATCEEDKVEDDEEEEDPISLFLRAKSTTNFKMKKILFEKSSNAGFGIASNDLGMMYLEGKLDSTLSDDKIVGRTAARNMMALKFLKRASDQGSSDGHYNLGNQYIDQGEITKAVEQFYKGAIGGSSLSMYNIGVANLKGAAGLNVNVTEARKWFERCGSGEGAYAIATTYSVNSVERMHWLMIAIQRGSKDAKMLYKRSK